VVIEFIKAYDVIVNFRDIILKNLPNNKNSEALLSQYSERLRKIEMHEFNSEDTVTPQIIQMTWCIDNCLNEIKIVFIQLVDDLVATKYEMLERENKMAQLVQSRPSSSRRSASRHANSSSNLNNEKFSNIEQQLLEIANRENELGQREREAEEKLSLISQKELYINEKEKEVKQTELNVKHESQLIEQRLKEIKLHADNLSSEKKVLEMKKKEIEEALLKYDKLEAKNNDADLSKEPKEELNAGSITVEITKKKQENDQTDTDNFKIAKFKDEIMKKHYEQQIE
jgi:hypothetical protein